MSDLGQDRVAEFSALIEHIYDAAIDPDAWAAVLDRLRRFLNTQTAALWSYDLHDLTPPWQLSVGYDPYWIQQSIDKYAALNPYVADVAQMEQGEITAVSMRPDYAAVFETEFYKGWLKPQSLIDASVVVIEKSLSNITTLANVRTEQQGLIDQTTIDSLRLIYPHIRRALIIGRVLREAQDRATELSAVLDSLAAGMMLLNARGGLIHANAAGRAILAKGAPLRAAATRIVLASGPADRLLRAAIVQAQADGEGAGDRGLTIPIHEGEDQFVLHLLPLNAARRKAVGADGEAAHVLFLSRREANDVLAVAAFAERFGLTPQEVRVLQTLVEVGSVPMTAELLGISASTARSHVTSIFDKSGVRRQAEVVRLLVEMKSPFVRRSASKAVS